jgi:hypothetical protein
MIINVARGQPELKVTLAPYGGGGDPPALSETRLLVYPPRPERFTQLSRRIFLGDWWDPSRTDVSHPYMGRMPVLVYPAFSEDEHGATVFRFDDKLWNRPPGRYECEVIAHGKLALAFDMDLHPYRHVAERIETEGPA